MQLSAIPGATSSELQLPVTSEQQLPTNSEQQLLLPGSAATSLPLVDNQSAINITSSPKNSTPSLREFLIYPATNSSTSTTPAAPKRSVPKARLLTSDENLAMLEEKEKAKKDALIEKEKKRLNGLQRNSNEKKKLREKEKRKLEKQRRKLEKRLCSNKKRLTCHQQEGALRESLRIRYVPKIYLLLQLLALLLEQPHLEPGIVM